MLWRTLASSESTTANTAMMAKMPTVTPNSESTVRNTLPRRASQAKTETFESEAQDEHGAKVATTEKGTAQGEGPERRTQDLSKKSRTFASPNFVNFPLRLP